MPVRQDVVSRITGIFSTGLGFLVNIVIIIFVGLYFAADPRLYTHGIIQLVPIAKRDHARQILHEVGTTLRWWLGGRLLSMTIIGVLDGLGLWLLGVPLPILLGLLAAILTFIPNLGPILAAIPAMLLALLQSPTLVLYVVALKVGVQAVESYLVTPLVQRRAVALPPVLTISAQVLGGLLLGLLGLILATPLTAATMVLVKKLYIEDVLGDTDNDELDGEDDQSRKRS